MLVGGSTEGLVPADKIKSNEVLDKNLLHQFKVGILPVDAFVVGLSIGRGGQREGEREREGEGVRARRADCPPSWARLLRPVSMGVGCCCRCRCLTLPARVLPVVNGVAPRP